MSFIFFKLSFVYICIVFFCRTDFVKVSFSTLWSLWLTFVILGFIVGRSVTCCTKSILNSSFTSGLQQESGQNRPFPLDFPLHLQNETFSLILFLIIWLYDQSGSPDIHIPEPFNHSSLVLFLKLMPPVTYWAGKLSMFFKRKVTGPEPNLAPEMEPRFSSAVAQISIRRERLS